MSGNQPNRQGTFEGRSQVSTWILSIARFKALAALGRRRDGQLDEASTEMVADTADTPEQTVLRTERNAQLRGCITQMSREHREVNDLAYYHDKSVEEVAEIIQSAEEHREDTHVLCPQTLGDASGLRSRRRSPSGLSHRSHSIST
jgi:RNA polymerase sigma factor (sigma-70 family)